MRLNLLETLNGNNLTFNYLPVVLKKNPSEWMVEFWCEDPNESVMKRMRVRVDRIRKRYAEVSEANAHIAKIVPDLNLRLINGWNSFVNEENARSYTPFDTMAPPLSSETLVPVAPVALVLPHILADALVRGWRGESWDNEMIEDYVVYVYGCDESLRCEM